MMKKRKNIGLLISHIENGFERDVCRGAILAAEEMDANLIIIPGRYIASYREHRSIDIRDMHYNTLFSLVNKENIDALVVSVGTICCFLDTHQIKEFLGQYNGIPVITLATQVEGYPCVRIDGLPQFAEEIEHIIKVHSRRRIAFIGGPENNREACERESVFRLVMAENAVEVDESLVTHGNFSSNCLYLLEPFLERNASRFDAIIFANDGMAITCMKWLSEHGYNIGTDFSVAGYDNIDDAAMCVPSLTTVAADPSMLGYAGVKKCFERHDDSLCSIMPGTFIRRESCGCCLDFTSGKAQSSTIENLVNENMHALFGTYEDCPILANQVDSMRYILTQLYTQSADSSISEVSPALLERMTDFMQVGLRHTIGTTQLRSTFDRAMNDAFALCTSSRKAISLMSLMTRFYRALSVYIQAREADTCAAIKQSIYLIDDVQILESGSSGTYFRKITEKMLRMKIHSGYIFVNQTSSEQIEPLLCNEEHPLICQDKFYLRGYCTNGRLGDVPPCGVPISVDALFNNRYTDDCCHTFVLAPMFYNDEHYGVLMFDLDYENFHHAFTAARQVCTSIRLISLIERLSRISRIDELTQVYNRRGFLSMATLLETLPENSGMRAVLMFADLNKLKAINDNHGHEEGDDALRIAASILRECFPARSVVGRIGGDEFAVFSFIEESECVSVIESRVRECIARRNSSANKPYRISLSLGSVEMTCGSGIGIRRTLSQADALQYIDKHRINSEQ